jgi:hypothetical protein
LLQLREGDDGVLSQSACCEALRTCVLLRGMIIDAVTERSEQGRSPNPCPGAATQRSARPRRESPNG